MSKPILIAALAVLSAAPAVAHEGGAHLHPHGIEPVTAGLVLIVLALAAALALRR